MKKCLKVFLILTICLFIFSGCTNKKEPTLEDKNKAELEYIDGKLVEIVNKVAKEQYMEDDEMKWDKVLEDTKKVEDALATTLVDLAALNIDANEIAKLSDGVNSMIISIDKKDQKNYLIQLNNVYALIPTYMEKYAKNSNDTFKKKLKYYTLSTYIAYVDGNLDMAKTQVAELDKLYSEKMQDMGYAQNNEYNLNQVYILIQELRRAVEADSSELVKSKYLRTIEEI